MAGAVPFGRAWAWQQQLQGRLLADPLGPDGLLLLEHHHDQSAAVIELLTLAGLEQVRAHLDLEGQQRFVSARRCWLDV